MNGTEKYIKLAIKQSAQKNKFWVHYVQTNSTENIPGRAKSSAPVAQILGAYNTVSQSTDKVKRQSRDSDYLSAVERGDMDTVQRMIDEAAETARDQERREWGKREAELRKQFREQRAANVMKRNTTKLRNSTYKKIPQIDKLLNRSVWTKTKTGAMANTKKDKSSSTELVPIFAFSLSEILKISIPMITDT